MLPVMFAVKMPPSCRNANASVAPAANDSTIAIAMSRGGAGRRAVDAAAAGVVDMTCILPQQTRAWGGCAKVESCGIPGAAAVAEGGYRRRRLGSCRMRDLNPHTLSGGAF